MAKRMSSQSHHGRPNPVAPTAAREFAPKEGPPATATWSWVGDAEPLVSEPCPPPPPRFSVEAPSTWPGPGLVVVVVTDPPPPPTEPVVPEPPPILPPPVLPLPILPPPVEAALNNYDPTDNKLVEALADAVWSSRPNAH